VPKRRAVAFDCEMAGTRGGIGTVILLSAVDYLTGETLVNAFVQPTGKVVDWRSRVSGVTPQDMEAAIARGEALNKWKGARAELWKHIDADTILVGHALQHDLDALRIAHTRVVDSAVLARNAVGPCGRQWGLKSLCEELLHIDVQTNGRNGHDCTEDALAAREVVLWCCRNTRELEAWGVATREVELRKIEERKKEDQKKDEERKEARKRSAAEGKENGRLKRGTSENQ
jgi:DNA polymerase III epsilon subunit-like protein